MRYLGSLLPGGWAELLNRNRTLVLTARKSLCHALQIPVPCPDEMIGSMATIPLPDDTDVERSPLVSIDPLQDALLKKFSIEVPIMSWPVHPKRVLRISAQIYNKHEEFLRLADALTRLVCVDRKKKTV